MLQLGPLIQPAPLQLPDCRVHLRLSPRFRILSTVPALVLSAATVTAVPVVMAMPVTIGPVPVIDVMATVRPAVAPARSMPAAVEGAITETILRCERSGLRMASCGDAV